jgi:hypothetical protein
MFKKTADYKKEIKKALENAGKYSKSLEIQIQSLAGALRTLDLANEEIDQLDSTVVTTISRYGNESYAPHPVFKIQKDAQELVTKQMKALGLTADSLTAAVDNDPLIDVTKRMTRARNKKAEIIKPDPE